MNQKYWTFKQDAADTSWNIDNVPDNAKGAVITHIESDDGQILQPDNQMKTEGGLMLSFGVEPVSGTAYGQYFIDSENVNVSGDGGVVNITINQNSGAPQSQ